MIDIIHTRFIISRQKMCNRFLQYLEKNFSCFGQDVNDDNSAEECSDRDDDDHSSSQSENSSSERESFQSYRKLQVVFQETQLCNFLQQSENFLLTY